MKNANGSIILGIIMYAVSVILAVVVYITVILLIGNEHPARCANYNTRDWSTE